MLSIFAVMSVSTAVFGMLHTPVANAMTSVTTFKTFEYLSNQVFYNDTLTDFKNYFCTWSIEFQIVESKEVGFVLYFLDHNYNKQVEEYIMDTRDYSTTNMVVDYIATSTGNTSVRYMDYLLQVELLQDYIVDVSPKYLDITYTSVANSGYDWTVKRLFNYDLDTGVYESGNDQYILNTYTFGNDYYRFSFTYVVSTTTAYANMIDSEVGKAISNRMYFSPDVNGSSTYGDGYSAGYRDAVITYNGKVYKESQSYLQGVIDGQAESNPFSFVGLFGAVADSQLKFIDGLLGFDFLGVNVLSLFKVIITMGMVYGVFRIIKG